MALLWQAFGTPAVSKGGETLAEAPLMHLEQVLVLGAGESFDGRDRGLWPGGHSDPRHGWTRAAAGFLLCCGADRDGADARAQLTAYGDRRGVTLGMAFASARL